MALENIFVFKKQSNGTYSYIPASGLLFGLGSSGTVVLGDETNKISGAYNSILGGSNNSFGANTSRSIIGGGNYNCIRLGNGNFITAGEFNYISGCGNSSNVVIGGCSNVILGNQSLIGGGCGNFLGAGIKNVTYLGAFTNTIVGGQYNCAFAANPSDAASIYNQLNGWNGVNFGGTVYYNPPCESVIVAGTQNRIGGCRSFVGAGANNWAIKDYSSVINGYDNKNSSISSTIINGCESFIANGCFNKIDNGLCNRIGIQFGEGILNVTTATQSRFSSIDNGCCNIILSACNSSIRNGCCNNITNTYAASIGGGQNNTINNSSNGVIGGGTLNSMVAASQGFIGGGGSNCVKTYGVVVGGISNCALSDYSSILGGQTNCISTDGYHATIGGGLGNCISASYGYIIGGRRSKIQSTHTGAAILGDGEDRNHLSSGPHTLTLDFASGVYFAQPSIIGNINFTSRPTVNGTGVLLAGEGVASPVNISDEGINQGSASTLNFVGAGISASVGGSIATITVNGGGGGGISFVSPPNSPSSVGISGSIALDSKYVYFCTATNTWIRTALASW